MPETDRFTADDNASFSEHIFNIAMAEIKAIIQPDDIGNDIWRESLAFVGIHEPILPISGS